MRFTPTMAREWFDFWRLISARRMEQRQRPLTSPFMDMGILDPALPTFWAIVERNLGRARRRYLRACGTVVDTGELMVEGGSILPEPSDDAQIPAEQDLPLILPRPFDAIHTGAYPRNTVQKKVGISNALHKQRSPRYSGN